MTEIDNKKNIDLTAKLISEADIFILLVGAGFSVDSGLSAYDDIANVPIYREKKITYYSLCQPQLLDSKPELFYGFWNQCANDYRDKVPHKGYQIIKRWKEEYFSQKQISVEFKDKAKLGPFFVYSSNVDHHFTTAKFDPNEVYEIHGEIETWQCAAPCKNSKMYNLPPDEKFRFKIDQETMKAPNIKLNFEEEGKKEEKKEESIEKKLENLSLSNDVQLSKKIFSDNHPKCPECKGALRPNILMFNDMRYIDNQEQIGRYSDWMYKMTKLYKQGDKKVVAIEIGCGLNVQTVRYQSESLFREFQGKNFSLVRINPKDISANGKSIIQIKMKGLEAILAIDEKLKELKK